MRFFLLISSALLRSRCSTASAIACHVGGGEICCLPPFHQGSCDPHTGIFSLQMHKQVDN